MAPILSIGGSFLNAGLRLRSLGDRGRLRFDLLCSMRLLLLDGPLAKVEPATGDVGCGTLQPV
jgi:hypothetical protein